MTELTVEKINELFTINGNGVTFKGDKPIVIDFYANWCGPCKMLKGILKEIEVEGVDIYTLDTELSPSITMAFGISTIPTMLYVTSDGKENKSIGAIPKPVILKNIEKYCF